jgi:hypothetical protein
MSEDKSNSEVAGMSVSGEPNSPPSTPKVMRDVWIPITAGSWIWMRGLFPLSGAQWDQMMLVLTSMHPGLVERSDVDGGR